MKCKKGEIYLINSIGRGGDNTDERKTPVVIVQNNIANKYSPTLIVAPINPFIGKVKLPTHVEIDLNQSSLTKKSVIFLEHMMTISKERLVERIGTISEYEIVKINNALEIAFDIKKVENIEGQENEIEKKKKEIEDYIRKISRPLVLTEGKTDVKIIETAWNKLYPDKDMFFECIPSGIEFEEEKRVGSADHVRRSLEFLAVTIDRVIIGIFDNDVEGNKQFKGLKKGCLKNMTLKSRIENIIMYMFGECYCQCQKIVKFL